MIVLRRIGLFVIAVGVLIAVLIWSLPLMLPFGLAMAGVDDVTFKSIEIGFWRARIDALEVGKPSHQRVATIETDYSLGGLLTGRIDHVRIDGLVVQAAYEDGALTFGGATDADAEVSDTGEDGSSSFFPFPSTETLVIENSRIDIETPMGPVSLAVNGRAAIVDDALQFEIDLPSAALDQDGSGTVEAKLGLTGRLPLTGSMRVDQIEASGQAEIQATDIALSFGSVNVEDIEMQRVFDLAISDRSVDVTALADGGKVSVGKVSIDDNGGPGLESGWFTVQWPGREEPWFRFDLDDRSFALDWLLEVDPARIDQEANRLWARIEDLRVTLTGDARGIRNGAILIKQGRADFPSINLALAGIESDILLDDRGLEPDRQIPLAVRSVRPLDEPLFFSPLRLDAQVDADTPRLAVDGVLTTRSNPKAVLDVAVGHDIESGKGSLDLNLRPITFSPGQLQPANLSPLLDGVMEEVNGKIALEGQIAWQDGLTTSDIALLIEELGFTIGPARLSRINSVIRLDGIAPLTTPRNQLLSVGLLDLGLPLTDGLVSMQLQPDGRLAVDQLTWRLANGSIRTRPFTFGSDVQDLALMLTAEQLDLDALLALTPLEDLTGEGRIDGTLPLRIGTVAAIDGGELAASGPGVLRYRPSSMPGVLQAGGESVRLMLQALENFRYEALRITLDGDTAGTTAIGLHLNGANPDLYDGHPVEFNLNLEGNLANLVQTNLDNYQIPDRIRERIQGFDR